MSSNLTTYAYPLNSTDADLEQRARAFLATRSFLSFRRLDVAARGGVITLSGRLSTYYEKQVAQETVRRVAGVLRVIDAIRVGNERTLELTRFVHPQRPIDQFELAALP